MKEVRQVFQLADMPRPIIRYAVGIWRRRRLIAGLSWLFALVGWGALYMLPDYYESSAELNINTSTAIDSVIGSIATRPDFEERVRVLRQQLLSPENVEQVIIDTGLDAEITTKIEKERKIESLTRLINVTSPQEQYFRITYADEDPVIAQKVVDSVMNLFIEKDIGASINDTDSAVKDIRKQISRLEGKLASKDQELAQFRQANANELSDNELLARRLNQRENDLVRVEDALARSERAVSGLRRTLVETPRSKPGSEIELLKIELASLRSQFNENYPDIQVLEARIQEIESGQAGSSDNPEYRRAESELERATEEVINYRQQSQRIRREIEELALTVSKAPEVLADLQDLMRDYSVTEASYKELLDQLNRMEITAGLNADGGNVSYNIFERPKIAAQPSSPQRGILTIAIMLLGLGAAGGIAFLLTQIDNTYTQVADLEDALGLPVLGSVSTSATPKFRRRQFVEQFGLLCAIALLVAAACLQFYFHEFYVPDDASDASYETALLGERR